MTTSNQSESKLTVHLSHETFIHILACLDKLRNNIQDEEVAKSIGVLMNDFVRELSPNQLVEMLSYFLEIDPVQAQVFMDMKKPPEQKPDD
tara:strand:+ start:234 stop:506 length:273 start_codon:yes stop_codon:yes gene_type:complete